jgi:hypothetical protein
MQVMAADDRSGDGIIPGGIAILDELHRHKDLALYRTWMGKLVKRGAQLVVISTAGEVGSEFELERTALRQARPRSSDDHGGCFVRAEKRVGEKKLAVLHEWAVPEGATSTTSRLSSGEPVSAASRPSTCARSASCRG